MKNKQIGSPASKWEALFKKVGVETDRLDAARSEKARMTILGNFLAQNVGREVPIEVKGRTGKATLRMNVGRGRQKHYHFEIVWDEPSTREPDKSKGTSPPPTNAVGQMRRDGGNKRHGTTNTSASKTASTPAETVGNTTAGRTTSKSGAQQVTPLNAQNRRSDGPGNNETWD
jgi:hypothetical protein